VGGRVNISFAMQIRRDDIIAPSAGVMLCTTGEMLTDSR
jgi:hypothetical protein